MLLRFCEATEYNDVHEDGFLQFHVIIISQMPYPRRGFSLAKERHKQLSCVIQSGIKNKKHIVLERNVREMVVSAFY